MSGLHRHRRHRPGQCIHRANNDFSANDRVDRQVADGGTVAISCATARSASDVRTVDFARIVLLPRELVQNVNVAVAVDGEIQQFVGDDGASGVHGRLRASRAAVC
jgi:hypothetical protein